MPDQDPREIARCVTNTHLPFLADPDHHADDMRPWSELADFGLVTNTPAGPSRTSLGEAVLCVLIVEVARDLSPDAARALVENQDGWQRPQHMKRGPGWRRKVADVRVELVRAKCMLVGPRPDRKAGMFRTALGMAVAAELAARGECVMAQRYRIGLFRVIGDDGDTEPVELPEWLHTQLVPDPQGPFVSGGYHDVIVRERDDLARRLSESGAEKKRLREQLREAERCMTDFEVTDRQDALTVNAFGLRFTNTKRPHVPQPDRDNLAWMGVAQQIVDHIRKRYESR